MAERVITLKLTIDPSGAITAVNNLVVGTRDKIGNALETPLANIAARGFGIQAVIRGMTSSFGEWIRQSNEGETAVAKLTQAMRQQGNFTEAAVKEVRDYAASRQNATGIDDDATIAIAAQLTAMKLSGDQLKQSIALTQDLSTLMDGDMRGAVRVIADAFNGNVGMLKRYVKGLDEADIKQRGTVSIIEQLTKAVGGQAEAVGRTKAGGLKIMAEAANDVTQTFGDLLKEALVPATKVITDILRLIVAAPRPIQTMTTGVVALAGAFVLLGTSMGGLPFIIGGLVTAMFAVQVALEGVLDTTKKLQEEFDRTKDSLRGLTEEKLKIELQQTETDFLRLSGELDKLKASKDDLDASPLGFGIKDNPERIAKLEKEINAVLDRRNVIHELLAESSKKQTTQIEAQGGTVASLREEIKKLQEQVDQTPRTDLATIRNLNSQIFLKQEQLKRISEIGVPKQPKDVGEAEVAEALKRAKSVIEVAKTTSISVIDNDEKTRLARATSESGKLSITRNAALLRIEAEETAALKILDIEERLLNARRQSASVDERTKIDRRIETIGVERKEVLTTTTLKKESVEVDFKIGSGALAAPGTLRALEEQITADRNAMLDARSDAERKAIRARIDANQAAADAMHKTDEELLADQRAKNEERKRLWAEQHQVAMVAINAIGAGAHEFWNQFIVDHRQAKDEGDAVWLTIKNTALGAIGSIIQKQLEVAIVEQVIGATKTARVAEEAGLQTASVVAAAAAQSAATTAQIAVATVGVIAMAGVVSAAMAVITATASVAATLVSIATFGGAAFEGAAAVVAALGIVKGAVAAAIGFGFIEGGELLPGEFGGNETNEPELIAPKRTFKKVILEDIAPIIISITRNAVMQQEKPETKQATRTIDDSTLISNIQKTLGFREGGELQPGEFGGNETNEPELIAPKRTFRQVVQQDILPKRDSLPGGDISAQIKALTHASEAKRVEIIAVRGDTRVLRHLESIENILRKKNWSPRLVGVLDGQTFLDENLKEHVARDNSFKR